jgi:hypothetical protein
MAAQPQFVMFRYRHLGHGNEVSEDIEVVGSEYFARATVDPDLSAPCERWQNLNAYGRGQRPLEICLVSSKSINQYRTRFDHLVETRI